MSYSKTTWVDEVLAGAERFNVLDNVGATIHSNVQIVLATGVTITGTSVNATNMNNIENGVYNLSRGAGYSVKGVAGSVTGDVADIVCSTDGYVLRRSGTSIGFGTIATAGIADSAVTEAKIGTGAVTSGKLGSSAVTAGKIASGGVSAGGQIASGIITGSHLATGAVTAGKIATGGLSANAQIADGIIGNEKLADHKELIYLKVIWFDEDLVTGNGQMFFTVPAYIAGEIVDLDISVFTASSSGLPTVQVANCGSNPGAVGTDILSTRATIDVGEWSSMTAVTQPVISSPFIYSGNVLRVDVDVAGTGTKGLDVFLVVEKFP